MKGQEIQFIQYISGPTKRFVIPVYQRNYDWKIENCKQLYDDLIKVIRNNRKSHFFGSVVSVYEPSSARNIEFLVIDGQQRLTTITLLLLAMYNLIQEGKVSYKTPMLNDMIYEQFLVDKYQEKDKRIKLKPIKNDKNAFDKLFDDQDDYILDSNITVNYRYFYDRIQKMELTIDELFDAICKLEIISIVLDNDDNPQLIFESLNSTGLDLSEGDKIRNFILMGLSSAKQNDYYEKYWNKIEINTKYDVSSFVRDYLSVKQLLTPSQSRIYITFKEYVEQKNIDTEDLLKDLLAYSKRYGVLLDGGTKSNELNASIYRLNRLSTTVTRPFFLEVLSLYDDGKLDLNTVSKVFTITESYLLRRMICDLPTNMLNKIFLLLHKEIIRYDGTCDDYLEKFKYALLSKREKARFPDDEEFVSNFSNKQIYLMNSKNKLYIFKRFENYGTLEDKDVYSHCDDGVYSIEHIMPQHLTPTWIKDLGDNYEEVHETWLHRMANLTLTAYNSKYSNLSFNEKKTMEHGFEDSGIRMNTYIASKEVWNEDELKKRNDYLMKRATDIWSLPETEFKPKEKQYEFYTLADDVEFTGRKIYKFTFKNTEQPVESWLEAYQKILQILYSENKSIITRLALSTNEGLESHFTTRKDDFIRTFDLSDGIYVFSNTGTHSKINVLTRIFALYNEDPEDLVFYLRSADDDQEYDVKRKFWAFALEKINESFTDFNPFEKVKPSKGNWQSGSTGIVRFNICCVTNTNQSRVELYLGNSDVNKNKQAFDLLAANKDKIEKDLNTKLIWERNDDLLSSKIYVTLENVSINNDADWELIAQFHAEWSKKFYDVLVPYLDGIF